MGLAPDHRFEADGIVGPLRTRTRQAGAADLIQETRCQPAFDAIPGMTVGNGGDLQGMGAGLPQLVEVGITTGIGAGDGFTRIGIAEPVARQRDLRTGGVELDADPTRLPLQQRMHMHTGFVDAVQLEAIRVPRQDREVDVQIGIIIATAAVTDLAGPLVDDMRIPVRIGDAYGAGSPHALDGQTGIAATTFRTHVEHQERCRSVLLTQEPTAAFPLQ